MSRRRPPRVPATFADRLEGLLAVASEHTAGPGIYRLEGRHDDGCPALETHRLGDCRCDPQFVPQGRVR